METYFKKVYQKGLVPEINLHNPGIQNQNQPMSERRTLHETKFYIEGIDAYHLSYILCTPGSPNLGLL